jgi:hypothetical protein
VPLTSGRLLRSSPRSLRSAVVAVCVTGAVSIGIPFGLLMGKGGLVTAGVSRQAPIPTPRLTGCATGRPISDRLVRPGQCVQFTGGGFGEHELIEVTESGRAGWHSYLRADDLGRFSWRYQLLVGSPTGTDVFSFIGTDRANPALIPSMAFCRLVVANR